MTLLKNLDNLELDGATAALEIWIDRDKKGAIDSKTLQVAEAFRWSRGLKRVHHQLQHVGIYGQWIDTWRAQPGSKEIALFLEDDLSISPYTWRWLKAVHQQYKDDISCAGYTLQSEGVMNAKTRGPFKFPKNDTVFMYQLVGSWGFAPHPEFWRGFQDWFHTVNKTSFNPYVKGLVMTSWYKTFQKRHTEDSMWTMWFIYYCNMKTAYCVFNNLKQALHVKNNGLCVHRQESGLHYHGRGRKNVDRLLLNTWFPTAVQFPKNIKKFYFNGSYIISKAT
jgi:hypothetical protein